MDNMLLAYKIFSYIDESLQLYMLRLGPNHFEKSMKLSQKIFQLELLFYWAITLIQKHLIFFQQYIILSNS